MLDGVLFRCGFILIAELPRQRRRPGDQYGPDGKEVEYFPIRHLDRVEPIYTELPGWQKDISGARKPEDLPSNARKYIEFIEKSLKTPVTMVGVGQDIFDGLREHGLSYSCCVVFVDGLVHQGACP